ncbi:hypothetical protein MMC34_005151 [Xylographa carneopallida]|nr:hypothetical protein [Xylographa carneopallida]
MAGLTMHDILQMSDIAELHPRLKDIHPRMTDPARLLVECLPKPEATTILESGTPDVIETVVVTTGMTHVEGLLQRVLERPKAIATEIVKGTNRRAMTVEVEAEALVEIDRLTLAVHPVVK